MRLWFEVNENDQYIPNEKSDIDFSKYKWFPYNKGGSYRKWYGNNEYIINWENNGEEIKKFSGSNLRNKDMYFREGVTWSTVSSNRNSFRYFNKGYLFDNGGSCLFSDVYLEYIQGLLNTKVAVELLKIQPTMNNQPGTIGGLPLIINENIDIKKIVMENIALARLDWDSFETSWDFKCHPLISVISHNRAFIDDTIDIDLAECYTCWENECNERFNQLKANEEELNRIFIDIYGLQDELTPEVEDKDVTVRKADLQRDIKSLISYAVGCMFGRYSLDEEGLVLAGQPFEHISLKHQHQFVELDLPEHRGHLFR